MIFTVQISSGADFGSEDFSEEAELPTSDRRIVRRIMPRVGGAASMPDHPDVLAAAEEIGVVDPGHFTTMC